MMRTIKFGKRKIISKTQPGYFVTVPTEWVESYDLQGQKVDVEMTQEGNLILRRPTDAE